jgi:sugar lactone lactonase YvrE
MREIRRGFAWLAVGLASLVASASFAMPVVPPSFSVRALASGLGVFPQAIDVTPDGMIYVADFYGRVFRVTPTGQVFPLNGPFSNQLLQGVVVRDSDDVFVSSTDSVFRLAPGASSFSVFSHNPSRFNAQDIRGDLAPRGTSLFMVGQVGSFPPLWTVDATTGTFAAFETSPVGDFTAVACDPRKDVLVGAGSPGLFEINPETGSSKMFAFSAPGEPVTRTIFDCETGQDVTVTINPSRSVGQATVHPVTGDVYFTTVGSHEIMRATRDGKVSVFSPSGFDTMGGNLETSIGIGFDDAGQKLYVTDRGTLYEISGDFVSIPCSAVYAFNEVTTSGGGESDAVNESLKLRFMGPVTTTTGLINRGRNRVEICPGSTVSFEADSTVGLASCKVNGAPIGDRGVVSDGDTLCCTNKPEGRDIDRFTVRETQSQ